METLVSRKGCAICDDAYGTHYVCDVCRADPANADWSEGKVDDASADLIEGGRPWQPTAKYRAVAKAFVNHPYATLAEIATLAGCSRQYVLDVYRDLVGDPTRGDITPRRIRGNAWD